MVRPLHPETQPSTSPPLPSRGETSLAVPATQTGLTPVPVTVFVGVWWHRVGTRQAVYERWVRSHQSPGRTGRGSFTCQREDDALQTPDWDTLPEQAENQKFWGLGEEGEKSMIGNFVASKLGAQKCWEFLAVQKVWTILFWMQWSWVISYWKAEATCFCSDLFNLIVLTFTQESKGKFRCFSQ